MTGAVKTAIADLPLREPFPGFRGRMLHSDRMSFAYFTVEAGADLAAHSHPHEQVVNLLEGEFEMVVDGAAHLLHAGDVLVIPGGAVHSGRAVTSCRLLDVFSPVREDYRSLDGPG